MINSLDEVIKHCEDVAETREKDFRECPYPSTECDGLTHCKALQYGHNKGCLKCAAEYQQLAELLKELKAYRDERVGCEYCKHNFRKQHERPCSLCKHNFLDMFEREVNADNGNSN